MTDADPGAAAEGRPIGPYRVVDTGARRRAGFVYFAMAVVCASIAVAADVPLLGVTGSVPLLALGVWQFLCAWRMPVGDMEAIRIAGEASSFGFGHGSATLGYRGVAAKPVWQVLVFSGTPSPDHQALVTVDAMTGEVTGVYEESVDAP